MHRLDAIPRESGPPVPLGPGTLLLLLAVVSFAASYAQTVVAPVLTEIGREFEITPGTAGLSVAAFGVPGVVLGFFVGPYLDRHGRRPFLIVGSVLLGACTVLGAAAPTFPLLVASRFVAGVGAALITPALTALVGDTFPYAQRGRAQSAIIGASNLPQVIGIPIAGVIAETASWRASLALTGGLVALAAAVVFRRVHVPRPEARSVSGRGAVASVLRDPSAVAAIASSFFTSASTTAWMVYLVVFFITTYDLSPSIAATVALVLGLGALAGSIVGGRAGDRFGHRAVVARTMAASAGLLWLVTNVELPLAAAAACTLAGGAINTMRYTANTAMVSEQLPEVRGTMLGIFSATQSLALVVGAATGGLLIDAVGFRGIGWQGVLFSAIALALVVFVVREERGDRAATPERTGP